VKAALHKPIILSEQGDAHLNLVSPDLTVPVHTPVREGRNWDASEAIALPTPASAVPRSSRTYAGSDRSICSTPTPVRSYKGPVEDLNYWPETPNAYKVYLSPPTERSSARTIDLSDYIEAERDSPIKSPVRVWQDPEPSKFRIIKSSQSRRRPLSEISGNLSQSTKVPDFGK